LAIRLEAQLICKCCGQPYHSDKSWEVRYRAVLLGAERLAICPICTQALSQQVFNRAEYCRRCLREVRRLHIEHERKRGEDPTRNSTWSGNLVGLPSGRRRNLMNIGEPLRTIIVEPLELPIDEPESEPAPEPLLPEPEPEQVPANV
jgi:hypothetical protein